jgi:hypothetical protein
MDVLDGNMDVLDGNMDVLDGNMDVLDGNVDVLDGNMDVLDGNMDVLDGNVGVLDGNVDARALHWMHCTTPPSHTLSHGQYRSSVPPSQVFATSTLVFSPSKLMASPSTTIYRFLANVIQASSFLTSYCTLGYSWVPLGSL